MTGRLIAPGDAGALGEALADILAGPEAARARCRAARAKLETDFSPEKALESHVSLYQELVHDR